MANLEFSGVYISNAFFKKIEKSFKQHLENELTMLFFSKGSGKLSFAKNVFDYTEGQLFILSSSFVLIADTFTDFFVATLKNADNIARLGSYNITQPIHSASFFSGIINDLKNELPDIHQHSLCVYSYIMQLDSLAGSSYEPKSKLVDKAADIISNEFFEVTSVEDIAEQLGVSKSHLIREFSKATGIAPGKQLEKNRIAAARLLMLHTDYSLDIIASIIGFSSSNYFCRVYKKNTGQTPNSFRRSAVKANLTEQDAKMLKKMQNIYFL